MGQIQVHIPAQKAEGYPVVIGAGILPNVLERVESQFAGRGVFVITDANVAKAGHLNALLGKKEAAKFIISPAGEASKNLSMLSAILEAMESHRLGRDTVVLALGGGTVGDIAGFAAAAFKRGVPIVQIPTTTVAQADSSIGGKTGVDSSKSKNAFGAFWHPSAVYIDVRTLATLDDLQYRAGLVESVKHGTIAEAKYFEFLEKNIDAILRRDESVLEQMALYNCRIKAAVVEQDPTEKNKRRILNYGHTIGHAVESASDYALLHGQAVAVGIIAAGLIEQELGLVRDDRRQRIKSLLVRLGMPTAAPSGIRPEGLMELLAMDKKAVGKWPRFVLLERLGSVFCKDGQWAQEVSRDVVQRCIEQLSQKTP